MHPIAIFHEHPDWFRPLFAELDRRGVPYVRLDAASHSYDPGERTAPYSLVFNRASPSAYLRGHGQSTFYTLQWLRHLERIGVPVVNGASAYQMDTSKALQLEIFEELGVPYPKTRLANSAAAVVAAAAGLRFPILVKANIGGSGAGIERFEDAAALAAAAERGTFDFGMDGVALVQEMAPMRAGHITRIEVLGGQFLYGINVFPAPDSMFNLCPADVCQTTDGRALSRSAWGGVACARIHHGRSSPKRNASRGASAWMSAALSISSTIGMAVHISTTSMPSRTSSRTHATSWALIPTNGSWNIC